MQAARGATLTSGEGSASPHHHRAIARLRALALAVAACGLAVDQVTKAIVSAKMPDHVHLVGSLLQLQLVHNAGAAFSTGTHFTIVLTLIAIVAAGVVLWFIGRLGSVIWAVALGLLLAGVCGNLSDRLFRAPGVLRGHVVDFLMLPHWPVFNVADMCINVAAALILVQAYRGIGVRGTKTESKTESNADPTTPAGTSGEKTPEK